MAFASYSGLNNPTGQGRPCRVLGHQAGKARQASFRIRGIALLIIAGKELATSAGRIVVHIYIRLLD